MYFFEKLRELKFLLPPEIAHKLLIFALKNNFITCSKLEIPESLNIRVLNNNFNTPIGLAAGCDKNAEVITPMIRFGFGFVEVGTVTKKAQYGNKKPRIFRLIQDDAVINRLGFNNKGIDYLLQQISAKNLDDCVFGVNIGKNKDTVDAVSDYVDLIKAIYGLSNYITINISSPNTPNLRDLHNNNQLTRLLSAITETRKSIDPAESVPILLKIAPDITDETKENIADLVLKFKIDGMIISNTTTGCREYLKCYNKTETGGLSGAPLFNLSTKILYDMYRLTKGKLTLIGCGGVRNGADAYEKIKSGASLVQIYTALIYQGLGVINKINIELAELLQKDGFANVRQAVGCLH